jgi:hypothetical protein
VASYQAVTRPSIASQRARTSAPGSIVTTEERRR